MLLAAASRIDTQKRCGLKWLEYMLKHGNPLAQLSRQIEVRNPHIIPYWDFRINFI